MIITFCGHSNYSSSLEDEERLLKLLKIVACGEQVDFYLGGYGGFDRFALKCATKYKQLYKNTKLVFITPYLDKWLNERKDILIKTYDEIIYPEIEHVPQKFAIIKRNEWMIINCELVICYIKTLTASRAGKFFILAKKLNKKIINLARNTTLIDL